MIVDKKKHPIIASIPTEGGNAARRGIQIRFSERRVLLFLVDSAIVTLTAWIVVWISRQSGDVLAEIPLLQIDWIWPSSVLLAWWVLAALNDLYDVSTSNNITLTMRRLVVVGVSCLLVLFAVWLMQRRAASLWFFIQFLLVVLPAIAIWRWAYAASTYRPPFIHRVLILGGGGRGRAVVDLLNQGLGSKCTIVGFLDGDPNAQEAMDGVVPLLGSDLALSTLTSELRIHEVVVTKDRNLTSDLFEQLLDCQAQGMRVSWMPDLYGRIRRLTPIEHIDPVWVLHAMEGRPIFSRLQQLSKRLLDLTIVVMALPAILLIMIPIAIAIRLDSKGPAFYRQIRAGRGSRPFSIYKFRTMGTDAEKDGQARWAQENDPRITRVGRVLRKARLDELPQVLNVLKGEMSIVGPRPERPEFISELQGAIPYYRTRLMVKPGITGWAQVQYEYGSSTQDALEKLRYDFYYIQYWSLWMDFYILYRTVGVMLRLEGR